MSKRDILKIMYPKWNEVCFYRISPETGKVQALRQSGTWGHTSGYGGTLEGVIDFYCDDDPEWKFQWVGEDDAQYD
jgi:hypothetical protein